MVFPDRALYLATFSHLLIVNKPSSSPLPLFSQSVEQHKRLSLRCDALQEFDEQRVDKLGAFVVRTVSYPVQCNNPVCVCV